MEFDLLGDPIPEGHGKRGRPPHRVTEEKRRLVMLLMAHDWSFERIASALSISVPTLRKNYFRELKQKLDARARLEAALYQSLFQEATAGNVAAIDKYLKRLDRHDQRKADEAARAVSAAPKLGKKEEAKVAAQNAYKDAGWGALLN